MTKEPFCPGCWPLPAAERCQDSFSRLGVLKAHWECWSECNLPCSFCYRTRGVPLDTEKAKKLLQALATAGISQVVFAGGDPSIRPDIVDLISHARGLNLRVEVQTNAHYTSAAFLEALEQVDMVGLSLDGPDALTHDTFRGTRGNFDRVISLMRFLNEKGVLLVIRTLVGKSNLESIPRIAPLLADLPSVVRWSLLEFTPIGEGLVNRVAYDVTASLFESVVSKVSHTFPRPVSLDIFRSDAKVGAYALITPSGDLYGTTDQPIGTYFPIVGSFTKDHLATLADKLPFSRHNHLKRYGTLMNP